MKLKKSKEQPQKEAQTDTKKGLLAALSKQHGAEHEISRQEKKKLEKERASRPSPQQVMQKVFRVVGQILIFLFVLSVIFSMVALPLLIVFN